MSRPLVIAHRGASGDRAENTWPAFELAVELSADMIETDLHLSRDEVVVIHHDAALERLGAKGEIRDLMSQELGALDAAPAEPGPQSIPTLPELLDRFGHRVSFNLELKVGLERPYDGLEAQVLSEVEGRGLLPRTLFSCFQDSVLARLRDRSDEARLAVLVSPREPLRVLERAARVRAEAVNPHAMLVDDEFVRSAHGAGLSVYPYTANARTEMKRLLDCGVDGVITNFPRPLRELIDARAGSGAGLGA